jgi:putative endonuclease
MGYNKYYFIYLVTNYYKSVLYLGVTNNLKRRLEEHSDLKIGGFSNRYRCKYLVHYEKFEDINLAIRREKEIKKWSRKKKNDLIERANPDWKFLNEFVNMVSDEYL